MIRTTRVSPTFLLVAFAISTVGPGCGKSEPTPTPEPTTPAPAPEPTPTPEQGAARPEGDAFRATRPPARDPSPLRLPTIEPWRLSNGLLVHLIPSPLPTVSMTFEFDVGSIDDPPDALGLASACLDLFSEGTERLDKVRWAEALADHAVSIFSPAGFESSTIVVRALESRLPQALDLLAELIRSPGLRESDLARILDDRRAALAQSRGTPAGVAARLFGSLVWGAEHPYGRIQQPHHLDAITLSRCREWVQQLRPSGARLWVVGSVSRERLTDALESRLATWTGEAPERTALPPAPPPSGRISAVHVPGAVQSVIVVGHPGPARGADDFEDTQMMAQIFGGSFSSRVNMNLREDKGYAYGARGQYTYRRAGSHLSVSASVEVSTTALALVEIAKEIRLMREAPPSAEELEREKSGALQALPARFAKPSSTADELRTLSNFGLPLDWFAGHEKRLGAVSLERVHEAARRHLAPDGLVVLVVGDLDQPTRDDPTRTVRQALEALASDKRFGAGGYSQLDPDGKPM